MSRFLNWGAIIGASFALAGIWGQIFAWWVIAVFATGGVLATVVDAIKELRGEKWE